MFGSCVEYFFHTCLQVYGMPLENECYCSIHILFFQEAKEVMKQLADVVVYLHDNGT